MKVKLKDNKKPISIKSGWCFKAAGYDGDIVSEINSGKDTWKSGLQDLNE